MTPKFQLGEVVQLRCKCIAKITGVAREDNMWTYYAEVIEFKCAAGSVSKVTTDFEENIFKMPLSAALKRVEVE